MLSVSKELAVRVGSHCLFSLNPSAIKYVWYLISFRCMHAELTHKLCFSERKKETVKYLW